MAQRAEAVLENPVHPGRARLQERIRKETPEETFLRLADNDSLVMLMPAMGSRLLVFGMYTSDRAMLLKLTRVRKLLADARSEPRKVAAFLQGQLTSMASTFDEKLRERNERTKYLRWYITSELEEVAQAKVRSTVAVYILSEINASHSLPTLAQLSTQGSPDDEPDEAGTGPVNRKFLFYAMHRLVSGFPEDSLPSKAAQARREYLAKAAALNIPEAKPRKVTSWHADYHEDDFRRMLPGKRLNWKNQPFIEMSSFPRLRHLTKQNIEDLLADLREFTQMALPE